MTVTAGLGALRPGHPALDLAEEELRDELKTARLRTDEIRTPSTELTKGWLSELAADAGTPAAVAGLVRVIHLWLKRDRRRSLTLTRPDGTQVRIEGEAISEATVRDAVARALGEPDDPAEG
ncbi:hypothetical protein C8054_28605 [Micromonospora sp. RP3T]|nr:hypothetical protein C8054_28605 [Micromonospora sp. RP3T]